MVAAGTATELSANFPETIDLSEAFTDSGLAALIEATELKHCRGSVAFFAIPERQQPVPILASL